jgi:hypothetical protein
VGSAALITPVEFPDSVSSMVLDTPASGAPASEETTNPISPIVTSDSTEQLLMSGQGAADTMIQHAFSAAIGRGTGIVVAATSSLVSTGVSTLATPLAGLTFQFGRPLIASATDFGGADRVFQALGRETSNPSIFATANDVFGRMLAGQLRLSSSGVDNVDIQWDEVTSDFDWQVVPVAGRRGRHEGAADAVPSMMIQHAVAEQDVLDRYFAQTVDDADQDTGDE